MASPVTLTALTPREAIVDALHRCILGIDSNDHSLFESSCLKTEDMTVLAGGYTIEGWTSINDFFKRLSVMVTHHITSNIRVELKNDNTASMTAHAVAYHVKPEDALKKEDASYTAASLYFIDLVRDDVDGLWKIKRWEIRTNWTTGDVAILHG